MTKHVSKERIIPAHKTDFGFTYPEDTVALCTTMLEVFNTLPEPGGVLDQDALLLDDILLYKAIRDSLRDDTNDSGGDVDGESVVKSNKPIVLENSATENFFGK